MPTRNINLTEHYDQFVAEQIGTGRYSNASEVLRAGLRLLEEQKQTEVEKLKILRHLATEGFNELDQGQGLTAATEKGVRSTIARLGRRASRPKKKDQAN
ncbi:Antitoxin ParD1 [Polystyrenella longa]|uniref:Antitoxin ParD1 n=1 Tax=Polystyrenella longa TaxID=2528007 RepID=A0A518CLS6_9PLAN|nr:type II toxin-antitoxin system ParD family antitoxin [Polystyrenella longa]QDU80153.1 Antitoxin ParD1 [Polystyrenella longa]